MLDRDNGDKVRHLIKSIFRVYAETIVALLSGNHVAVPTSTTCFLI